MCRALCERGLVWELNDLTDYTNKLIYQQPDTAVSTSMGTSSPERHVAIEEEERSGYSTPFTWRLFTMTIYSLRWNLVWHANVSAIENPVSRRQNGLLGLAKGENDRWYFLRM